MTDTKSEPNYQDILDKYADSIKSTEIPTPPQPEPELQSTQEPEALLETELTPESKLEINSQSEIEDPPPTPRAEPEPELQAVQEPEQLLESELTPESKLEIHPSEENEISENSESVSEPEINSQPEPELQSVPESVQEESPIIPEISTETSLQSETPILTAPPTPEAIGSSEILPPKENHFFKYLFFFSLFIFVIVLITIISTFVHSQQSLSSTAAPTAAVLPTDIPKTSCDINGQQYTVGETFVATDGCNKCSCNADLTVVCTEMACESTSSNKLSPTSKLTPTLAIPANWKTYTNPSYKFSFKYPNTYTLKSDTNENMPIVFLNSKDFTVPEVWGNGQVAPIEFSVSTDNIETYINKTKDMFDPKTFIQSKLPSPLVGYRLDGVIKEQGTEKSPFDGKKQTTVVIQISNTQKILKIEYDYSENLKETIFSQIISTFKFN